MVKEFTCTIREYTGCGKSLNYEEYLRISQTGKVHPHPKNERHYFCGAQPPSDSWEAEFPYRLCSACAIREGLIW